jgi:hypothetical protein
LRFFGRSTGEGISTVGEVIYVECVGEHYSASDGKDGGDSGWK